MIKKEDLIWGSVIVTDNKKIPIVIEGFDDNKAVFEVQGIEFDINGTPKLSRGKVEEIDIEKCYPAKFDVTTPFIKFRNYDIIVEILKKNGYTVIKKENNTRTISWIDGDKEQMKIFNEVHLFQKFIYEKINEYLEVEL